MRPCHDIKYGAQKEPAYRVRVRLVRVIKGADHGGKKNAKSELKIPFTGQTHDPQPDFRRVLEDVRAMQLAAWD